MKIWFNGDPHEVDDGATIAALLQRLKLQPRYVAVEVNRQLIPRDRHDQHVLQSGDRLEVVTLVGGG